LWLILNQFNEESPVSIRQAIDSIGDDELSGISLYFRPVSAYIKNNLAENHYLDKEDGGYTLSQLGLRERAKLENVVSAYVH